MTLDTAFERPLTFPKNLDRVLVPPIKCQGIKTRLVRSILSSIKWDGEGKWLEPFLGSGVVLFNALPKRALSSDTNKHVIEFYESLQSGKMTPKEVRDYLEDQKQQLEKGDGPYYYEVRKRFNSQGNPFDFLFLSRACFNGVMRFNSRGEFNVPYNHKSKRFSKAYVTKIVNQVTQVSRFLEGRDWEFKTCDFKTALEEAEPGDFAYLDPPYPQRHNDYYNKWSNDDVYELAKATRRLPCGFALSLWKENVFRKNASIETYWPSFPTRTFSHFYHVGSKEKLRHAMDEALIIKPGFEVQIHLAA